MPGFIPAANVVRVALRFLAFGNEAFNILHVRCAAPATSSDLTAIAAVFQSWWAAQLRLYLSVDCSWKSATLTALDSAGSPFLVYTNSGAPAGSLAFSMLPPQVTVAVSFSTGLYGRSYRGRAYMVGLCTALAQSGGTLSSGPIADITSIWDHLRTDLIAAGYHLCIASFYSGKDGDGNKLPRSSAVVTDVTAVSVHARIDTQRRRLPKEV